MSESTIETTQITQTAQMNVFDLARRGYDRHQVDEHMRTLVAQLSEVRQAHKQEYQRAEWAERELRTARAQMEEQAAQVAHNAESPQEGFGYRVEKLLRTAEQEAAEVRNGAAREATALLERAREDAESHRHNVEQSLITRTAALDQEAAQRKVALDERERQISAQAASAREDADRLMVDVRRQADQLMHEARARAEQERVKVEQVIRDRQEQAEQELARLRALHDEVRGQLARLLESLAGEFGGATYPQQPPRASRPPSPRAHPHPRPRPESHDVVPDPKSILNTEKIQIQPDLTEARTVN